MVAYSVGDSEYFQKSPISKLLKYERKISRWTHIRPFLPENRDSDWSAL